jgi:hypothetical protein
MQMSDHMQTKGAFQSTIQCGYPACSDAIHYP